MVTEKPVRIAWDAINPNPRDKNKIINFYKSTDSYIYELMASNNVAQTLYSYSVLANKLKDLNVNTILDYGAGAGTLSIILKQIGYNIIYADLTGKTFEFAKWRFKQRNIEIPMINLSENLDLAKLNFDCILCTEVIEHLVDPIKLLNEFSRLLKKNGILVVSESCEYVEEFSSHLESNRKYGGENFIKILKDLQFNHIFKEPFIPQLIFIRE